MNPPVSRSTSSGFPAVPGAVHARPTLPPPEVTAAQRHVAVHFVPWWPKNPYHAELSRHLAGCNVTVRAESRLKDILALPAARRPDVVHVHALPPLRLQPVRLARLVRFCQRLRQLQRSGVRIVWTVHNLTEHESAYPWLDRLLSRSLYRRADAVIVHSPAARAALESQWRVRRSDVSIIHHGHFIDCYPSAVGRADARRQLGVSENAILFLFLGNIRPYKGVRRLVQQFKQMATPATRLIIAGETHSSLNAEIEREIDGCGTIMFRPEFVADDQIQHYMAAADAVVFPYTKALTSGALILAMSFGRACIAPRMGALGDTLDEAGGFLYNPDDESGLRRALCAARDSHHSLARMGAHNRVRAASWGWHEAASQTAATYRSCLTSTG